MQAFVPFMRQDAESPPPAQPSTDLLPLRTELELMASELLRAKHQQSDDGHELFDKVLRVKVQLLRLLTEDLVSRLRNEWRLVVGDAALGTLEPLLQALTQDAQRLQHVSHDRKQRTAIPQIKTAMRQTLWQLRCALEPFEPPAILQMLVEQLRSCLMDNKFETLAVGTPSDHEPSQVNPRVGERDQTVLLALQLLVQDNFLMLELLSLRILQQEVQRSCASWEWAQQNGQAMRHLNALRDAATHLHLGTYRVRGRSRLLQEARDFAQYLTEMEHMSAIQIPTAVRHSLDILQEALVEDMAYATLSPGQAPALHGESMLLRPRPSDIPNFEVVVPNRLLRGGQPTLAGIQWLRDYGVRVTIDLRGTDRANQWNAPHEEAWGDVRLLRFHVEDFAAPTLEQVLAFVQLVNEPSNWPLYVSCKAGIGRTGTMVACWRITQGTSVEQALAQESLYATDGGGIAQESFVRNFAAIWKSTLNQGNA
ncbi:hypothetical protein CCYA_CCYA04G1408 [Cyanidiococcus yangmingshanensis]|nr:hypothetical protein CCYA_CCYA04G1408 [Cyanidiococcus yangmingshanensis]